MKTWLLDTGPLVAYLDASEPAHSAVAVRLDGLSGRLVTTSAVITEAMHFVAARRRGPALLAELVEAGAVDVVDFTQLPELRDAAALMEKYADTPMDYADATLVLLAERLNVADILTLDRRGFSAYRTRQGQAFSLVLNQ